MATNSAYIQFKYTLIIKVNIWSDGSCIYFFIGFIELGQYEYSNTWNIYSFHGDKPAN